MSRSHKDALAQGRSHSLAVRRYLDALAANRPKRGRKRTIETIRRQLDTVNATLADPETNQLTRLQLTQSKKDLEAELDARQNQIDIAVYEKDFIAAAKKYGENKGISYSAWREIGVAPDVLKRAGIARGTR